MIKETQNCLLVALSHLRANKQLSYDVINKILTDLTEENPFFINKCEDLINVCESEKIDLKKGLMDEVSHQQVNSSHMIFGARSVQHNKLEDIKLNVKPGRDR